jgi:hypothetical protein
MTDKAAEPPEPGQPAAEPSNVRVVAAAVVVTLLAAGWFLMSHFAMHTDTADALGEALGVALGLLLVISVVGAVAGGRRRS